MHYAVAVVSYPYPYHELGLKETKENYWELTCNTYIYMYKNFFEKLYWQTKTKNLI